MRKLLRIVVLLAVIAAALGWYLSRPMPVADSVVAGLVGDPVRGETVFWAGGCAACHAAPGAEGDDRLVLAGGYRIESPFGVFVTPNISPSPQGIGPWSAHDLANALMAGVSPEGTHYYPSLPYTTYIRMEPQDVVDLKSFMDGLPPSDAVNQPHELGFPFNIRRGLGLWKLAFLDKDWVQPANTGDEVHGRYLVEALGHCGECHTPRNFAGALDRSKWLQGAPNPSGKGKIPGINAGSLEWSVTDVAYYLESGFTPEYDSAGGEMAHVVANMSHLSAEDREAIAAYVKAVP